MSLSKIARAWALIADKIIIRDEIPVLATQVITAPPIPPKPVQVSYNAVCGRKTDHVTEFTVIRAPPGSLNIHDDIIIKIDQIVSGYG